MLKIPLAFLVAAIAITTLAAPSHPPLRTVPAPSRQPLPAKDVYFVDAGKGDDGAAGNQAAPWKTIGYAFTRLAAGDTLCLRGGTYYEQVACSLIGRPDAPITIRAFPGERAILSGAWAQFSDAPETAWEPLEKDEYRSTRTYPNQRNVMGWFGDSMIGLNTYFQEQDLRAEREVWEWADWEQRKEVDALPLYCGPGIWYDAGTGRLHARLAHTAINGMPNYTGETDPRKLPLVLAPFRSTPLTIDSAQYVTIRDLVIQGGGHVTVVVNHAEAITFDNVTIWCGSYGMRATGTVGLKLLHTRFYGSCPPWLARSDTSKRAYPGKPFRDITRLNTHAPLVPDNGREYSVFATPVNDDWEIAHCEFTDCHDGPYLGGISMRFHHNLVENMQDDGVYLSQMYPRHLYDRSGATLYIYQNIFRQTLTAFAFGGSEDTKDTIYIYRNLVDQRRPVYGNRPSSQSPEPNLRNGSVVGDHGSPPWSAMNIYQNTFLLDNKGNYMAALLNAASAERPRRVFNNIVVNVGSLYIPILKKIEVADLQADHNIYWSPAATPAEGLKRLQKSRQGTELDAHSLIVDPLLLENATLAPGSPAIDAGQQLPEGWPDSLHDQDQGTPDIGAFPAGVSSGELGPAN